MHIELQYDRNNRWATWKFFLYPYGKWREVNTPFYRDWGRIYWIFGLFRRQMQICLVFGEKCKKKPRDLKLMAKRWS